MLLLLACIAPQHFCVKFANAVCGVDPLLLLTLTRHTNNRFSAPVDAEKLGLTDYHEVMPRCIELGNASSQRGRGMLKGIQGVWVMPHACAVVCISAASKRFRMAIDSIVWDGLCCKWCVGSKG